jgi:serine/threonine-protein kinase
MSDAPPAPAGADRNLLFGILALQMDLISRDALIAAMHAWVLDKARPLGYFLRQQGALTTDDEALLDALVHKHLQRHGDDVRRSLAAVPVPPELHGIADPDVQASLSSRPGTPDTDLEPTGPYTPPPTESVRYRVLRPHARGGLGEVFVAEDTELHRQVALKEIQKELASDPHSRGRFLLEAEITGGLEHPGIVPVYGLGCYPDGRPYYAMRFIRGDNLKEAVQRFHQADRPGRDEGERRLAFRELLGRFVDVCQAVAYAHSRGVLHRDLKPGNVMLGKYGETLLVDWGLAKPVGRTDAIPAGDEATLRPSSGSAVAATQAGTALGTPAYMSPEQAAGRLDLVGPASDIYGLGATLYALLTGQAPFTGIDKGEVLRQVQRGEVVPPRKLKPATPAALEAICLKAMALRPEDRYGTALELAADVESWLADEPVAAYHEPWVTRARRWARRHRPLVAGLAAALAVAVLLGGAGMLWLQREAAQKRLAVEAALARVTELQQQGRWKEAQAVLDQAADRLSDAGPEDLAEHLRQAQADLTLVARLDTIRQRRSTIVENKLNYRGADRDYAKAFADAGLGKEGDDVRAVAARIRTSAVQGELVAALDDWAATTDDPKRRAWLLGVARRADPDPWRDRFRDPAVWGDCKALQRLADDALKGKGTSVAELSPQILAALGQALQGANADAVPLLSAAQTRHPSDFWLNFGLGFALDKAKKPGEAVGYWRAALALRPESAVVHNNLGSARYAQRRLDEAIGHFRKAIALDPDFAYAHNNLGSALDDQGQWEEAIEHFRKAIALDPSYATAHYNLGKTLQDKGQLDEAIGHYRKALDLDPTFATAHHNLGNALADKGHLDEAIGHYRKALGLDPKSAGAHYALGRALADKGRLDEAIGHYRKALALDPKFAYAHSNLGTALYAQGRLEEAIGHYQKALAVDPKLVPAHYGLGCALQNTGRLEEAMGHYRKALALDPNHAEAHCNLGLALRQQGQFRAALTELQRGHQLGSKKAGWAYPSAQWVKQVQWLVAAEERLPAILNGEAQPANADERIALAKLCQGHKRLYADAARFYAAAFAAEPKLADDLQGGNRYNAACAAALAAAGKGEDTAKLTDPERAKLRQQALTWLQAELAAWTRLAEKDPPQARTAGQQTLRHWQQDPDLAGVRGEALARLPAAERNTWRKLWADVDALLKQVASANPGPAKGK